MEHTLVYYGVIGGTGGTGGTDGEEMSCSCKLPLLDGSSESGRKLNSAVSRVVERKKRSTRDAKGGSHHHYPSNSYSSGSALGNLFQVVILASLAALAAYGNIKMSLTYHKWAFKRKTNSCTTNRIPSWKKSQQ